MRIPTRLQFGSLILTLSACLSAALIFSSCKKTPQERILGKWNVEGQSTVVEYRKDGTAVTTAQNGEQSTSKYQFTDGSHLELEASVKAGTNTITLRLDCTVVFHDDQADMTLNLPGQGPGKPPVSKTLHYTRVK